MLDILQFLPQDDAGPRGDRMAEADGKSPVLNGVVHNNAQFCRPNHSHYVFVPIGPASLSVKMHVFIRWFRRKTARRRAAQ